MKKAAGEETLAVKAKAPRAKKTTETKAAAKPKVAAKPKAESKPKAAAKPKAAVKAKAVTAPKAAAKPKAAVTKKAAPAKRVPKTAPADLAGIVAAAAMEHKLINPVLVDLSGLSSVADWFFIATAENARQMGAIADKIIRRAREHGSRTLGREGQMSEKWALVDLGDVIVHLFSPEARELYDLEGLWADAPKKRLGA